MKERKENWKSQMQNLRKSRRNKCSSWWYIELVINCHISYVDIWKKFEVWLSDQATRAEFDQFIGFIHYFSNFNRVKISKKKKKAKWAVRQLRNSRPPALGTLDDSGNIRSLNGADQDCSADETGTGLIYGPGVECTMRSTAPPWAVTGPWSLCLAREQW